MISLGVRRGPATFLFAAIAASSVSSYAYHLVMTRLLGPSEYGALGALLAALLVIGPSAEAVQAVVARRMTLAQGTEDTDVVAGAFKLMLRAGIGVSIVGIATAPLTASFLHIGPAAIIIMVAAVAPSFLAPVGRGVLQGSMRFRALGISIAAGMGVRLVVGTACVLAGGGLIGALLGVLAGEVAAAITALHGVRVRGRGPVGDRAAGLIGEVTRAGGVLLSLWLAISIDVVLARHYLPGPEGGRYAAAALVGRTVLFTAFAIATVLYPRLTAATEPIVRARLLRSALLGFTAFGVICATGAALFPRLVALLVGAEYGDLGIVVPLLALAMTAFGCVTLLSHQQLALGRGRSRRLWLIVAVQALAITLFHDTPEQIAVVVLAMGCAAALSMAGTTVSTRRRVPAGELWASPDDRVELSVVTPTYNGERVIGAHLRELLDVLTAAEIRHEVIVVSDGSTDGTVDEARPFEADGVRLLHYPRNHGKGYALRTGLSRATGRWVAFIDADGDLHPSTLVRFLTLMKMYDADMVIGSKRHALSEVQYPPLRRVMSWSYHKLVAVLFGIRVQDTQTGVKLVRRSLLAEVLPVLEEERFAFDLELLAAARRAGYRRILEAPVILTYRFASTVSFRSVTGILRDTAAIWFRCYVTRRYDHAAADTPAPLAPTPPVTPERDLQEMTA